MFHQTNTINKKAGFTLVELLIVIAIIGLLASVVMLSFPEIRHRAKVSNAQSELHQLYEAINMLYVETGMDPNHLSRENCVQNPEVYLDKCAAGLECNDGGFSGWSGPYFRDVPKDPWGTYYFFDPDYKCYKDVPGCGKVPDGEVVRAIVSFGPNKVEGYDHDNVVKIICVP